MMDTIAFRASTPAARITVRTIIMATVLGLGTLVTVSCGNARQVHPVPLVIEHLMSARVPNLVGGEPKFVTLRKGKWERRSERLTIQLDPSEGSRWAGTFEGNRPRVVATLMWDGGGSGTFYHLVFFSNKKGQLVYMASTYLGDRVEVEKVSYANGIISVAIHDPRAGERTNYVSWYKLIGKKVVRDFVEPRFAHLYAYQSSHPSSPIFVINSIVGVRPAPKEGGFDKFAWLHGKATNRDIGGDLVGIEPLEVNFFTKVRCSSRGAHAPAGLSKESIDHDRRENAAGRSFIELTHLENERSFSGDSALWRTLCGGGEFPPSKPEPFGGGGEVLPIRPATKESGFDFKVWTIATVPGSIGGNGRLGIDEFHDVRCRATRTRGAAGVSSETLAGPIIPRREGFF
jgi:hypothetical protein